LPSHLVALLVALAAHAALLLGVRLTSPPVIAPEQGSGAPMLILVEEVPGPPAAPPEVSLPAPPEPVVEIPPVPPAPPPEPLVFSPPVVESRSVAERSAPRRPPNKPAKLAASPAPRTRIAVSVSANAQMDGGAAVGARPQAGDRAHATWRNRVTPAYPSAARAARQSGRVLVQVNVSASGQATDARVASSSGFPALDQAALTAARASSYLPRTVAGVPQADSVTIPYNFQLDAR
jgi:protein TonB